MGIGNEVGEWGADLDRLRVNLELIRKSLAAIEGGDFGHGVGVGGFNRRQWMAVRIRRCIGSGMGIRATARALEVDEDFVEGEWRQWMAGVSEESGAWRGYVNQVVKAALAKGSTALEVSDKYGVSMEKALAIQKGLKKVGELAGGSAGSRVARKRGGAGAAGGSGPGWGGQLAVLLAGGGV